MMLKDAEMSHTFIVHWGNNDWDYRTHSSWYVSDLAVGFTHNDELWVMPLYVAQGFVRGLILKAKPEDSSGGKPSGVFQRFGWYFSTTHRERVLRAEERDMVRVRIV